MPAGNIYERVGVRGFENPQKGMNVVDLQGTPMRECDEFCDQAAVIRRVPFTLVR